MDQVVLTLPPQPRHAATARVVAAAVAADAGFDVDAIDDLRLAVNEAVAVLTDQVDGDADPDDGPDVTPSDLLTLTFRSSAGRVEVDLVRPALATAVEFDDLAATILGAVVDHHELLGTGIRLVKLVRDDD